MQYIFVIFILFLTNCAPTKPLMYGMNKTDNYVRKIRTTKIFIIEPQWPDILKRQPIISGHGHMAYADLITVQSQCNKFHWAHKDDNLYTPNEAQIKGWGDCKDAAICKYYKLRALGAKPQQLNLWQGWYGKRYEGHMTLAVKLGKNQYILDDMNDKIIKANDYMHKTFEPYARLNEIGWDID